MLIRDYMQYPCGRYKPAENRDVITKTPVEFHRDYPRNFSHRLYQIDGTVIALVKVPSRKKEKVVYDVCIAIMGDPEKDKTTVPTFLDFRAFSNSPSFYFRHARTFKFLNSFIDFLSGKYDKKVWEDMPKGADVPMELGYERTVYTALYYLQSKQLLSFPYENLLRKATRTTKASFQRLVKHADAISEMEERSPDTKQEKARKANIADRKKIKSRSTPSELQMKQVAGVVRFKSTDASKRSHRVSRSSKIKRS